MGFYECCRNCYDSIVNAYNGPAYSDRSDSKDKGATHYKRYCMRRKCFVEDNQTCEDWMPKRNV